MATSGNGRKTGKKSGSSKKKSTAKRTNKKQAEQFDFAYKKEVIMLAVFAALIFIFLCVIKVISSGVEGKNNLGDFIRIGVTGIFGISAYYLPIAAIVLTIIFRIIERDRSFYIRFAALILLMVTFALFAHLFTYGNLESYVGSKDWAHDFFFNGTGGGFLFGAIALFLVSLISKVGAIFVCVILTLIGIGVFVLPYVPALIEYTQREREEDDDYEEEEEEEVPVRRKNTRNTASAAPVNSRRTQNTSVDHDLSKLQKKKEVPEEDIRVKEEYAEEEPEGLQLMGKSVPVFKNKQAAKPKEAGGINIPEKPESNNIHRVVLPKEMEEEYDDQREDWIRPVSRNNGVSATPGSASITLNAVGTTAPAEDTFSRGALSDTADLPPITPVATPKPVAMTAAAQTVSESESDGAVHLRSRDKAGLSKSLDDFKKSQKSSAQYRLPSVNLLKPFDKNKKSDDKRELEETARRLEETLETFGVRVHVTDYSKGPAVTRYELQPEMGVKVSKIVSLADDIKLNLAASDIRIEAPIPGKQAVGIEVPNLTASSVGLRELFESKEYKEFKSNITFAVGKDIAGDVVVSDLAKMPHMLIAGATGSGKSVCINTLIMSILFKANPDDVKLILIDPKVVELSVYNGIPHLLLPVVTDPKQASAALQWGVNEMTERYKRFADLGVRDLKGFNEKVASQGADVPEEERLKKMPQVVIIVDELADLMMVASKEVEESICRLAQLARAAGIHLIIATQRPSVDVITGLIKANMPSRIAFSVSSGIDSRTILDSNGAEKLLGKGDMLFFPQWLNKPSRVQGAFISDEEVANVVDFIKNQNICSSYQSEIPTVISSNISGGSALNSGGDDRDEYFAEAGRFVIDKEKGSIGMLQRIFKIGFNRAARIMDQLEEAGVVGPEEGTKPRRILMNMEEFEEYLQNQ